MPIDSVSGCIPPTTTTTTSTTTTTTTSPFINVAIHGMRSTAGIHANYFWYSVNDTSMLSPTPLGSAFTGGDVILGSINILPGDVITIAVCDNVGPGNANYTFNSQYGGYPGSPTTGNPCGVYTNYSPGTSTGIYVLSDGTSPGC